MRSFIRRSALLALPLIALCGSATANADKLLEMCKAEEEKPESCDCQVKAITDNADPRYIQVMVAMLEAMQANPPADPQKAMTDALAAAGLTQEEFTKMQTETESKIGPAMEACKAG